MKIASVFQHPDFFALAEPLNTTTRLQWIHIDDTEIQGTTYNTMATTCCTRRPSDHGTRLSETISLCTGAGVLPSRLAECSIRVRHVAHLGHRLCTLRDGMFGQLTRKNEPHSSLDFSRGDGRLLRVRRELCATRQCYTAWVR